MKSKWIFLLLLTIVAAPVGNLIAQTVPGTLSYQGILMQSDFITPITDGAHSIVFNFYTVSSGGSALFSRTVSVTTAKGLYTCIIGGSTSPNAPFNSTEMNQIGSQQIFIGITVDAGGELSPRAQLTPGGYAFQAQSAYAISDNAVTSAKILDGTIVNADIASATITDSKLATISTAGKVSGNAITSGTIGGTTAINTTGGISTTGSVGVGIATPAYKLHVTGTDVFLKNPTSNSAIHMRTDNAGDSFINNMNGFSANGTTANNLLTITGQSAIRFSTGSAGSSGTERMRIDNTTGNVGIGTSNAQNKLDVEGAVAIGSTFSGSEVAPTNGLAVEGFTRLGNTVAIKTCLLEGQNTSSSIGGIEDRPISSACPGATEDTIISITVLVKNANNNLIPPGYNFSGSTTSLYYWYFIDPTTLRIRNHDNSLAPPLDIMNRPYTALIIYR